MSYENQSSNWIFLGDNHFTMDIGFNSNITIADIYGNSQPSLFIVETGLDLMNNFITEFKTQGLARSLSGKSKQAHFATFIILMIG